jgi:hypothetical protein
MMKRVLIASAVLLPVLFGCQGAQPNKAATNDHTSEPAVTPDTSSTPEPKTPRDKASEPVTSNPEPSAPVARTAKPTPLATSEANDPLAIAKRIDLMLGTLQGVKATSKMHMDVGEGWGRAIAQAEIQSPREFRIQYVAIDQRMPTLAYLQADGQRVGELVGGKPHKPGQKNTGKTSTELGWTTAPVGKLTPKKAPITPLRPLEITRLVFAGLADGTPSVSNFINALKNAGYKIRVDQRSTTIDARVVRNYIITANKGGDKVEMVVDGELFLPVTINASAKSVDGKPQALKWSTSWKNGVKFDQKDFELPPD